MAKEATDGKPHLQTQLDEVGIILKIFVQG